MLSNCRHNEDIILWEYAKSAPKRIIDIGASDGITNSNSRLFIENGWEAILIEPQLGKYLNLRALYGTSEKYIKCLNYAIADHNGETDFLYNPLVNDHSRIPNDNYYSKSFGDTPTELISVTCVTLEFIFMVYPQFKDLGVLCIDTEGYDEVILKHLMKTDVRPKVLICEHHTEEIRERQTAILTDYNPVKKISANVIYTLK